MLLPEIQNNAQNSWFSLTAYPLARYIVLPSTLLARRKPFQKSALPKSYRSNTLFYKHKKMWPSLIVLVGKKRLVYRPLGRVSFCASKEDLLTYCYDRKPAETPVSVSASALQTALLFLEALTACSDISGKCTGATRTTLGVSKVDHHPLGFLSLCYWRRISSSLSILVGQS